MKMYNKIFRGGISIAYQNDAYIRQKNVNSMIKPILKSICFSLLACLVLSCSDENAPPDVSGVKFDFKIRRLDKELRDCQTPADVKALLDKDLKFSEFFFRRSQYPHDSILVNSILDFIKYEYTDTLFMDVERIYSDQVMSDLENKFYKSFQYLKHYYPDYQVPELYFAVSGFGHYGWGSDLKVSQDYLVVGLDYFSGKEATYRPPADQVPDYMLRRYNKEHMVPIMMTAISYQFNEYAPPKGSQAQLDNSLLADMIFYGKAYYFVNQVVPFADDSLVIGYTEQDLLNVHHSQVEIYTHFIERKLFFETTDRVKNKYVGEAPRVVDISNECPGRIGRWLGWQIVKHYMYENEDITLQLLMKEWNARKIFESSKYRPVKPDA